MKNITVLIAEANLLIRRGLYALLVAQEGIEVVGEAESASELLSLAQELHPDVITIDCTSLEKFCVQDVVALKQTTPQSNILAVTTDAEKPTVLEALKSGVSSYLLKECGEQELVNAVRATAKGEKFMCNKVLEVILADSASPEPVPEVLNLSPREIEIVQLIADGKSTVEIAETLFLSHHTINSHRKNILRKLQIKSPAELIVKALDLGIVKLH
ncbi:LuxR C-terminal-related transcriptional regulator [Pontibacter harenae]|uniref:LuxR C-terminal-related transcriptional regulator n=1 Tax=Pontibacter harenae TaxID=2894083 RepID=UPI001E315A35|nr:response regulator transcription factor [Pontibacter harenae]MCC9167852.1 response regulator transcription factor [Pontibacter harenae]